MADRALFVITLLVVMCQMVDISAMATTLPKSVEACKRNDQECLFRSVTNTLKLMNNGIPKLGLTPTNPMKVSEMFINQGTGPVSIKLKFTDQDLIGMDKLVITSTNGDFTDKSYRLNFNFTAPKLTLKGDYAISGKILVLPIQGEGKNVLSFDNVVGGVIMSGRLYEKDGEQYVEIDTNFTIEKTTRIHFKFDNLFNGNKALGDNMNKFLNDNWDTIWRELQISVQASIAEIFSQIANRAYSKVPYILMHPVS